MSKWVDAAALEERAVEALDQALAAIEEGVLPPGWAWLIEEGEGADGFAARGPGRWEPPRPLTADDAGRRRYELLGAWRTWLRVELGASVAGGASAARPGAHRAACDAGERMRRHGATKERLG